MRVRATMGQKELWRLAPKEQKRYLRGLKRLNKRIAKSAKSKNRSDGAYLRVAPKVMWRLIPCGGLLLFNRLWVRRSKQRGEEGGLNENNRDNS